MSSILGIGIATLDIVNTVDGYPAEDQEVRAVEQRVARGGNATNTLVILSQLGHTCAWGGLLAAEPDADRILEDLRQHHVEWAAGHRVGSGKVPTSYVTLNRRNGSRSIVHHRDLPEFSFEDFRTLDLRRFDWIHFEGRNVPETQRMLARVRSEHPGIPCSIEIEKARGGIERLFPLADLLLFSKSYAAHCGFDDGASFLSTAHRELRHAQLVCAWGKSGAWAVDGHGQLGASPAFVPTKEVDTLGAGDVFNAGVIHARLQGQGLGAAITYGCRLAGAKCGQVGLEAVVDRLGG